MKRIIIATLILLALFACATFLRPHGPSLPGVITIEAQSLPITRTLTWDANPATDAVTHYVVRLDGAIIGSPTGLTQLFTITALGAHTLSVVAVNVWAESAPTTLAITVVAPAQPAGLRIQ